MLINKLKCSRKLEIYNGVQESYLEVVTTGEVTSDCQRSQRIGRSTRSKMGNATWMEMTSQSEALKGTGKLLRILILTRCSLTKTSLQACQAHLLLVEKKLENDNKRGV